MKLGVTHVLNAAEGKREKSGTVDTNKEYYEPWGITYKGDLSFRCFKAYALQFTFQIGFSCESHCKLLFLNATP